jgi:hypothetical protein
VFESASARESAPGESYTYKAEAKQGEPCRLGYGARHGRQVCIGAGRLPDYAGSAVHEARGCCVFEIHVRLGESAFNISRAMGHSHSTLVDAVYAHSLQSGMASVAERVTALALGEQPKLRVIDGKQRDVTRSLDESPAEGSENRASA